MYGEYLNVVQVNYRYYVFYVFKLLDIYQYCGYTFVCIIIEHVAMDCENIKFVTQNSSFTWNFDDDGFLRCKTTVLKSTVLDYSPDQIGADGIPDELKDRKTISLFVPKEELGNEESLESLEGKPVSIDHIWQAQGKVDSVGNISGKPFFDLETGLLFSDILVTDPDAIERITSSNLHTKLVEQSAGYRNTIEWTPGVTEDGKVYDGIQRNIRYNHIALLPQGKGRAGGDVRILNKDEGASSVTEFTNVCISNSDKVVRVLNEDVEKLRNAMEEKDKSAEGASANQEDLEKQLQEIERLNNQISEDGKARDELVGQVSTLTERIEALTNPETVKNSLNSALAEQESASKIINAFASKLDEKQKSKITSNLKSLHGSELHAAVVNEVRSLNKKDGLTEEEKENSDKLKGMFIALNDTASMVAKNVVSGTEVVKSLNKAEESKYSTVSGRIAAKYESYQK